MAEDYSERTQGEHTWNDNTAVSTACLSVLYTKVWLSTPSSVIAGTFTNQSLFVVHVTVSAWLRAPAKPKKCPSSYLRSRIRFHFHVYFHHTWSILPPRTISLYKPLNTSSDGDFDDIWDAVVGESERKSVEYRSVKGEALLQTMMGLEHLRPTLFRYAGRQGFEHLNCFNYQRWRWVRHHLVFGESKGGNLQLFRISNLYVSG